MSELEVKTNRLIGMLETEHLDAVLLNAQHNFAWLTGGGSNGVDLSRESGVASLLITRSGKRYLLANTIETQRMLTEELPSGTFDPIEYSWQNEKENTGLVIEKANSVLQKGAKLGSDVLIDGSVPVVEQKVAACRYELTPEEIGRYKLLGQDAGTILRNVLNKVSPGNTELEIAELMRADMASVGISSVVTLVAADERIAAYRHPIPTSKKLKDMVMLVTCAKRDGLIVSLTRLACWDTVPAELADKIEATAYVNARLLASTRPGAVGSELYAVAATAYTETRYPDEIDLHHQGGATGYRTRDWAAHPQSREVVRINQAFAWNPSITGTKVEETVIVTESGVETITASPDFPLITTVIDGREYHSPGILIIN